MAETILVVDDEKEITDLVAFYLEKEGFSVLRCYTGAQALEKIRQGGFALAILDVMLPDIDGFALCRHIREGSTCPIIMLTARIAQADRITGLTLGADDYVLKPFLPLELVARVKAQLRRAGRYSQGRPPETDLLEYKGLSLNEKTHTCTLNGRVLNLTPTEFAILAILCRRQGEVVSAEDLFHGVWGEEYYTKNNNTITVHIRHLREKMGDSFENPSYIKTVWGVGYKMEG